MTLAGYDAAYPPGAAPVGDQVVMGYLGGNTPHVWAPADWASQRARFRIGIWTRSNPIDAEQGTAEGIAAAAAWKGLGATPGSLIVLDYETAINAGYVQAFDAAVRAGGFRLALYGSKSTLFQNPAPSGGYFPADLTGTPHLYPGAVLTQYRFESAWDDDVVSAAAVLWDTQPPAPDPAPAIPSEVSMIQLMVPKSATDSSPGSIWLLSGSLYVQVSDSADNQAFTAAGVGTANVDWAQHEAILAAAEALKLSGQIPLTLSATGDLTVG